MGHNYGKPNGERRCWKNDKGKVPGEGRMYQFEGDTKEIKEKIRTKIHDGMADEAKYAFTCATELFQDLMEVDCEHYLESVN